MIKTMKKSLLLTAAIAAIAAMAVPSMASAANWSPVGTYHTLSSPSSINFTVVGSSPATGFTCASGPSFVALVRTPASPLMDLTSTTTNLPCTGTGSFAGYSFTLNMIALPVWSVDGTSGASNVSVNAVNITGTSTFFGPGAPYTITGTLTGGVWSNLTRTLAFANDTGLTFTMGATIYPLTVTASEFIKDTTSPFLSL